MKTATVRVSARSLFPSLLSLALFLTAISCGSYGNGRGGGGVGVGVVPYITGQPINQTVAVGQTATFSVAASGTAPLSYQWRKSGGDITGATSSSYTTPPTIAADNGATFDVVVSNSAGSVTSNMATLAVTSGSGSSAGWTWVQDSPLVFCSTVTGSSCTITSGNLTPTVGGSVWILSVQTQNNVTMTSVAGGGGTWVHCPNCHSTNPSGHNIDAFYNLTGNAGTTAGITITLSGNSGFFSGQFIEILPPPGATASFDTSGIAAPSNCSGTSSTPCTAVSLPGISGNTDVIVQSDGGAAEAAWNSWSAPYIEDANGYGICLNCTSGTAPTVTYFPCGSQSAQTTCNPEYFAMAFKSSAGIFTPPTQEFSLVNYTAPNTANRYQQPPNGPFIFCSAGVTCSLPIPATSGSGHLLFLAAGNEAGSFISSVTCSPVACPGWTMPSGAGTCQQTMTIQSNGYAMSCAYNLSIPSGVTSLNITMSRTGSEAFVALEASSVTGAISFDAQNNFTGANQQEFITSPVLNTSGSNDFVIQLFANAGGSLGSEFYALPYNIASFNYFFGANESIAILPNSGPTVPQITWINCCFTVSNPPSVTFGSGVAFKAQ